MAGLEGCNFYSCLFIVRRKDESTADISFLDVVLGLQKRFNTEFLGMESEFLRCYATGVTNDHVEQYHSRLLTLHPIRRCLEGRTAMFAYPTHNP